MAIKIVGSALPNLPWQDRPEGCDSVVWRYSDNPIVPWNPFKAAARVFNSAVVPWNDGFIGVIRCDYKNGRPHLHVGRSKDGIHWKFDEQMIDWRDEQGTPAALRSHKDDNHKPELMHALSNFFMLRGFAKEEDAIAQLSRFDSLKGLAAFYMEHGLKEFVKEIFSMDKAHFPALFDSIAQNCEDRYKSGAISKRDPLFWFMRAVAANKENGLPYDAGLLMILIMNLMYVPAGGVAFQGAGVPHAYLEDLNIELMANSDNVVRGGLTTKHVDVKELLAITVFESESPKLIAPMKIEGALEYQVSVPDFRLREYRLRQGEQIMATETENACLWMLYSGEVATGDDGYHRGVCAFYQRPGEICEITATTDARIFRASCYC